jgi:hypothetical protein
MASTGITSETDIAVLKAVISQLVVAGLDYDRLARDLGGCSKSAAQQRWYSCRDRIFGKVKVKGKGKAKAGWVIGEHDIEDDGNDTNEIVPTPAKRAAQTPATASKLSTAIKKENMGGNRILNTPLRKVNIVSNTLFTTPKRSVKKTAGKRKRVSDDEMTDEEDDDEEVAITTPSKTPVRVLPARKTRGLVRSTTMVQADTDSEPEDWETGGVGDGEEVKRKSKKIKTEADVYSDGSDWGMNALEMGT